MNVEQDIMFSCWILCGVSAYFYFEKLMLTYMTSQHSHEMQITRFDGHNQVEFWLGNGNLPDLEYESWVADLFN